MMEIWKRMGRRSTFIVGILIGILITLPVLLTPAYHPVAYETIIVDNEILYNDMYQYYVGGNTSVIVGDKVILISWNTTASYENIGIELSGSETVDLYVLCFCDYVSVVMYTVEYLELDTLYIVRDVDVRGIIIFLNMEDPVLEIKIWIW
jgi:hypothetical protein